MIDSNIIFGRLRLLFRWNRFIARSLVHNDVDFIFNALKAISRLFIYSFNDIRGKSVLCNVCGWKGYQFYPNVGPGYYETNTTCPKCLCQDRHRALAYILEKKTDFFTEGKNALEVAPMRSFEQYCLEKKKQGEYLSFDYERHAMEKDDVTCMSYQDEQYDFFLCLHVMEHIQDETKALSEIKRVLKTGGTAIFQVPLDWELEKTLEYVAPKRRETGHVRKYGQDFENRLTDVGFKVSLVSATDVFTGKQQHDYGFDPNPFFFAKK